jgi:hypothetical protein
MTSTLLSFHNLISPSSFISFSSSLVAGPFPTIIDSRQQTKSVKMAVPGEMNALHYSKVSVETHGSFIEADCHSPAFCYYNSIYLTPVNAHGFIVPYMTACLYEWLNISVLAILKHVIYFTSAPFPPTGSRFRNQKGPSFQSRSRRRAPWGCVQLGKFG